jgi:hypothetical protein
MKYTKILCLAVLFLFFSIHAYAQFGSDNTKPIADAGTDMNVKIGEKAELQGSGSDMDNDPLTFTWAIVFKPSGSKAVLSDNKIPNPTFIADAEGDYMFNLRVNDGQQNSLPDTVTYTAQVALLENNKPIADAGTDMNVKIGEKVELHGSGSDIDNDTITFMWSMLSKPENSRVFLSNETIQNPEFIPDIAGFYAIQLITNDGKENSNADTVIINAAGPAELCIDGTCDVDTKQWCSKGVFVSEDYCTHCRDQDNTCLNPAGGFCRDDSDCESGLVCISWVCSETKSGRSAVPDTNKDITEDNGRGVGRILFLAVILIIIFGALGYAVYYYRDYLFKPKKTSGILGSISKYVFQPVLRTPEEKKKVEQIVKKRRKAKKEERDKFFEAFYK